MKVRIEFWKLSSPLEGVSATLLDQTLFPAQEYAADTAVAVVLPVPANRASYAALVSAVSGSAVVDISSEPDSTTNGRLVTEGKEYWFLINNGDKLMLSEYL